MGGSLVFRAREVVKISATSSSQLARSRPRYWAGLSSTPSTSAPTEPLESTNGNGTTEVQPSSLVAGVSDQCTNCGARLSSEQRYCVECGERRGQSRLPFGDAAGQGTGAQAAAPPPRKRPRLSANAAAIAGVGTLVLALGVGVLIGRSGNHGSSSKNPVQVIRVGGGTAAAAGAATTTASNANSAATKSKKSTAKKAAKLKQSNPGAAVAGGKDAAKQHLPPATVKVGQPGHGRGYKNGTFTGDFFGQ
jgi:hypothetical protein